MLLWIFLDVSWCMYVLISVGYVLRIEFAGMHMFSCSWSCQKFFLVVLPIYTNCSMFFIFGMSVLLILVILVVWQQYCYVILGYSSLIANEIEYLFYVYWQFGYCFFVRCMFTFAHFLKLDCFSYRLTICNLFTDL